MMNFEPKQIEIPKIFQSFEKDEKFSNCLICNKPLLVNDTQYVVEKAIRKYNDSDVQDVIFEYAMCFDCVEQMHSELSEESNQRIMNYFMNNVNLESRMQDIASADNDNIDNWLSKCMIKGTSINELNEYVISAHCINDKLLLSFLPYMISEDAMDEMTELLSKKTSDFLNGFRDKYFGLPPEYEDIFKRRLILL